MHNNFYKTVFLILFLSSSLFGVDLHLLTHYRNNGINDIEKELDKKLAQESYWNDYLKNIDTSFGYFESYTNILTCDKSKSRLSIYKKDDNNTYQLKKEYSAYTGKMKGDKHKEGDLRTPVGVYNIVKKITKVDSFYGPMAFVTSYPNIYDKYQGKTGQGIWIHGLPIKQERDEFTKGCIAINNQSIECLDRNIDISKTILIIDEESVKKEASKERLSKVLASLFAWRYSWIYNDIDTYLSFYTPEFKRFDGMNFEQFKKYKTRIFNKNEKKTIIFRQINVIPYPDTKDIFKIAFLEKYKSNSFSFTGNKVLIVKLTENKFNIITER
ncbi:L,D-transpeptidase family protein [Sulfurimonas sp. NWX79]|uniref:L,D-transpeptidase family protein n=1 Tax=Sulfurimonas sp. NWX79 TaxID=2925412 RepID=UPI0032049E14